MEKKMKPGLYLFVSMLLVGALNSPPAQSQEVKQGDLVISQPWSRAAPAGAELANGYLTIENKGTAADRLIKASSDGAEKIEIQKTSMSGGATVAEAVEKGLAIPAGEKLVLAPGVYKLALMKLKSRLKKGTKVLVTLEFEKAGKVDVPFDVLGAGAKGPVAPKDDSKMKK
jgi:copper(I)-binding protein